MRVGERKRQRLAELEAKVRATNADSSDSISTESTNPAIAASKRPNQFLSISVSDVTHTSPISASPAISSPQPFTLANQSPTPLPERTLGAWVSTTQEQATAFQPLNGSLITAPTSIDQSPSGLDVFEPFSLPTPSNSENSASLDDLNRSSFSLNSGQSSSYDCFLPGVDSEFPSFLDPSVPLEGNILLDVSDINPQATEEEAIPALNDTISPPVTKLISQYAGAQWFPTNSMVPTEQQQYNASMTIGVMTDGRVLDVPLMKVMRAGSTIADMLKVRQYMWDPFFTHVLRTEPPPTLPPQFKPTTAQKHIPHHPIFDLLPWASARTKLICIFSQPIEMRPPAARDPLAVIHLIMDIDDEAEGFRLYGEDGFDDKNWEVGEKFFQHWWWALDREIVENSNRLRAARGARRLKLTATSFWCDQGEAGGASRDGNAATEGG